VQILLREPSCSGIEAAGCAAPGELRPESAEQCSVRQGAGEQALLGVLQALQELRACA
jgi:hypothetical protein